MRLNSHSVKAHLSRNKEMIAIVVAAIASAAIFIVIIIAVVALLTQLSKPTIVYQPAKACDLLSASEATELLGSKTIPSNASDVIISDNTGVSKCGYTDGNPDINAMVVAAIIVRSAINDNGVQQNKTEFVAGTPKAGVETVKGIGDRAYFNQTSGQLNVLDGKNWIVISYGVGNSPETNTVEKAVELARKVVR